MVLGGRAPSPEFLASLARGCELWAVDRGVEACRAAGIAPAVLVGDRDSGSAEGWRWAAERGAATREYQSDKDLTDFQLALEIFADERKNSEKNIILTGALGGRFDHLWSLTLSFLNMTRAGVPFGMMDDREGMIFVRGGEAYALAFARRPKALSLLAACVLARLHRREFERRTLAADRRGAAPRRPIRREQPRGRGGARRSFVRLRHARPLLDVERRLLTGLRALY